MSDTMFLYKVGFSTFEESLYHEFSHRLEFTEDELWNMVGAVLEKVAVEKAREDIKDDITINKSGSKSSSVTAMPVQMGELMRQDSFIKGMKSKGFKTANYVATVDCDGWSSVFGNKKRLDDWHPCEKQKKMHKRIRKFLEKEGIMYD